MKGVHKKGFAGRMRMYFREMYPLGSRFLSAAVIYAGFTVLIGRVHGVRTSFFSLYTPLGIWNLFIVSMILRLMDELKDKQIDIELFKDRPLPSGRVLEADIRFSIAVCIVLYLVANAWDWRTFWIAAAVVAYSSLMFKHFFVPRVLRKNLLLTLITHNPIVAFTLVNVVFVFSAQHDLGFKDLSPVSLVLVVVMFWAMFFAWEISRKIRSKDEEDEYVTYSRLFGRVGAVLVAGGAQTAAFAIAVFFLRRIPLSRVFMLISTAGYAIVIAANLRFVFKPSPTTSRLKPFVELYIGMVALGLVVDHFAVMGGGTHP